jgi:hypothetical protein
MANLPSGGIAPVQAEWSAPVCDALPQRCGNDCMCSIPGKRDFFTFPAQWVREACH